MPQAVALDSLLSSYSCSSSWAEFKMHTSHFKLHFVAIIMFTFCLCGCERKEKIVDIETPAVSVEVERSPGDGSIDVDVTRNK
jgi:hypothetical protein